MPREVVRGRWVRQCSEEMKSDGEEGYALQRVILGQRAVRSLWGRWPGVVPDLANGPGAGETDASRSPRRVSQWHS